MILHKLGYRPRHARVFLQWLNEFQFFNISYSLTSFSAFFRCAHKPSPPREKKIQGGGKKGGGRKKKKGGREKIFIILIIIILLSNIYIIYNI